MAFTPRLTADGIVDNPYWYDSNYNPYYPNFGMPNCTAYCYGRSYEILNKDPELPLANAEEWVDKTSYPVGTTPKLGSIQCFDYGEAGHVATVEVINEDGSIITSNSAWQGTFFWLETVYPENNYKPDWASYYDFKGFIYLPIEPEPEPVVPEESNIMFHAGHLLILLTDNRKE